MTPSDFSVLLLAWDDADPGVAVFGGAALPPTLPLVYHLAAEQAVLAVFPHLPEETAAKPSPEFGAGATSPGVFPPASFPAEHAPARLESAVANDPAAPTETAATEETEASEEAAAESALARDTVGIRRLTVAASGTAPAFTSLLIGLENRTAAAGPADAPADMKAALPGLKAPAAPAIALARSQWPTGAHAPRNLGWSAPAAPYLGTTAPGGPPVVVPVPPLVPAPTVREAADLAQAALSWPAGFSPLAGPVAAQLLAASSEAAEAANEPEATHDSEATEAADATEGPNQEPFTGPQPAVFEETTEEVGAAEANDLSAPEDDLTPDAPAEPAPAAEALPLATAAASAPEAAPEPGRTARTPSLDGLNSRMIQYARQAAQLVQGRSDFGVIYAPSWPAWLAALEIRNSSRRPLVLYAASLAADFARPAERGWLLEVERMTLRRAHLILVPTEHLRQRVRAAYGTDTGEVRVVPADDEAALRAVLHELAAG
ncbi:glycosyltransferase family 4 protein [Hymenobacter sp. M29]|uniref:Glycosyltransferase family 4 protein n=1 Tax=Hymenobacter mellowenesis TaxID=3063995 RepID=A0ABT9AJC6_9BACT|nr:glycosyltransferase family 4 protein [Hymenobacter sp. M29]MDO7849439.1 glycosyltransferase family 4 protein [Hymenobacter sp. M29]